MATQNQNSNPYEDTHHQTEETEESLRSLLFFVKKFVLSAERIGLRRSSGNPDVITELTAAASRSIPFAGPVIEKAFIRIVKSIQHHSQVKGSYQVELAVDEKVPGKFRDDEKFRLVLIEAAIQVYYGFEYQLKNVYYKSVGESQRKMAVKILATVAGEECVKQLIRTKSAQNIHQSLFENGLDRRVLPHHRELLYQINNTDGDTIFAQKTTRYIFFKMCIPTFPAFTTQESGDFQAGGSLVVVDKKRTDRVSVNGDSDEFHHLLRPCFAFEVQPTNPKRLNFVDLSVASIRRAEEFIIWKNRSDLIDNIFERLSKEKPCNIELETLHEVKDIKMEVKDIKNLLLQREGNKYKVKSGSVLIMNNLFQSISGSLSVSVSDDDNAVDSICGKNHPHYRKGAEKDSERMRHFFQDVLANHVTCVENVKSTDLDGILKEFKKNCMEQSSDYLVLIIMSHGGEKPNTFLMDDLVPIDFHKQVFNKFNHHNFPLFTHKPKLFFLDFCNGADYCGVQGDLCDSPSGNGMELNPNCETVQYSKIRDYFIGQAACPSAWSYLNTTSGSFYSQALVKTFQDYWGTTDLICMHKYVCDSVNLLSEQVYLSNKAKTSNTNNSGTGTIQQPIQSSDLRLQFFFCQNNNDASCLI